MRVLAKAFLLLMLLPLAASRADAQSILVRVTESETGTAIPGAFVSLLDAQDQVIRSALTNETGRFLFTAPRPAVYRVKGEMIGRETRFSPSITVGGNESSSVELALPVYAIPLAGIEVEADEQCHIRPEEASVLARVWEEARTALSVQAWAEREGSYRLQVTTYDRDLDAGGRRVERETRKGVTGVTRTPFVSLPPEDLMEGGFIRALEEGGHQYFGPDATVLLSDLFLDTHCFRLARSRDLPGSIGLEFEPARAGDGSDIQGTLWLDEKTAELQFLEFGYTQPPFREAQGVASGRVEFESLPDGAWIIHRWWIKAPILARHGDLVRGGDSGIRVEGIRETGGEVTRVSTMADESISQVELAALSGLVWDSIRGERLAGATVYLSGTSYAAVTDEEGRFQIDSLPGGVFTATFDHPRLDSLGVLVPGVEVEVVAGQTADLLLATPSEVSLLVASCREEEREGGAAVLTGIITDGTSGKPIPGAKVRVEWQGVEGLEPVVSATDHWLEVSADGEGRYVACGIPLDEAVQVRASFLDWKSPMVPQGFTAEERRILDLAIDLPLGLLSDGSRATREAYGAQGVQGVLVEPGSGNPIRSAEVSVRDAYGAVTGSAVTDNRGFFRIQTPTPGRYIFSAQALGYAELEDQAVEVPYGKLAVLEVRMAPAALELEPLVVTAEARAFNLEMEGFYERESKGLDNGIFFPPEVLEERQPRRLSDLFLTLPGVRVAEPALGAGGRAIWFRSGERLSGPCWPMVYLDRHLVSTGGFVIIDPKSGQPTTGAEPGAVDELVHGLDVSAVEVYRNPAEIPPEFNGPNAGCGVIVIWTKRGGGR